MRVIGVHNRYKPRYLNSNEDIIKFFDMVDVEYTDEDFKFLKANMKKEVDVFYAMNPYQMEVNQERCLVMDTDRDNLEETLSRMRDDV
jgi:hypothetical protein